MAKSTGKKKRKPLTASLIRYELFARAYLQTLDATAAAQKVGYSKRTAAQQGCRLLKMAKVQAIIKNAIDARARRLELKADNILREIARLALSDVRDVASWTAHGVRLKPSAELTDEAAACISEVSETVTKEGTAVKLKLHDKKGSLELAGRHLGLFKDNVDMTLKIKPILIKKPSDGSSVELKHTKGIDDGEVQEGQGQEG